MNKKRPPLPKSGGSYSLKGGKLSKKEEPTYEPTPTERREMVKAQKESAAPDGGNKEGSK